METQFRNSVVEVQRTLRAPKNRKNTFGNYSYRSAEDILEAVKPLLAKEGLFLTIEDDIVMIGQRFYVKATATLSDGKDSLSNVGFAREEETKKGQDGSQLTGTASSYARKYALNGLFCIDDNQDADTMESIRAQVLAQVVTAETRAQFEALYRQYYSIIKADPTTYKAFERMAVIIPKENAAQAQTAEEMAQEALKKQ